MSMCTFGDVLQILCRNMLCYEVAEWYTVGAFDDVESFPLHMRRFFDLSVSTESRGLRLRLSLRHSAIVSSLPRENMSWIFKKTSNEIDAVAWYA